MVTDDREVKRIALDVLRACVRNDRTEYESILASSPYTMDEMHLALGRMAAAALQVATDQPLRVIATIRQDFQGE